MEDNYKGRVSKTIDRAIAESILADRASGNTTTDYSKHADKAVGILLTLIQEAKENHFQSIVPDEGPLENTKGSFADGYAQAIRIEMRASLNPAPPAQSKKGKK